MANYRKLAERRLQTDQSVKRQVQIVEYKLKELVGKPDVRQKLLIEAVAPLYVQLFNWKQEFLRTGKLSPKYTSTFSNVKQTLQQLRQGASKAQSNEDTTNEDLWADL